MPKLIKIEKIDLDCPKVRRAHKPFLVYLQSRLKKLKREDPDFQVRFRFSGGYKTIQVPRLGSGSQGITRHYRSEVRFRFSGGY